MKKTAHTLGIPMLAALLAQFLTGCPAEDVGAGMDGPISAARRALDTRALREVIDGPGAGEAYERYIERGAAARTVTALGRLSERWLREAADTFTYDALLDTPDAFRGKIVFAYMIVGEIRDLLFRAGGERLKLLIGGTPQGEFYACIYPERAGQGRFYGGDVVWFTGTFVKVFSFVEGGGQKRRVPLLAGPPPTYTKDWFPYKALLRELGLETFFPVRIDASAPPPSVFIDVDDAGLATIGGVLHGHDELTRRLDGLTEASKMRGVPGVVLIRQGKAAFSQAVEDIRALCVERGVFLIERGTCAPEEKQ